MGLKTDIENAFLKNIKVDKDPDYEVSAEGKEKVSVLAEDLANAILDYFTDRAVLRVDKLSAPVFVPIVTSSPSTPIPAVGPPGAPLIQPLTPMILQGEAPGIPFIDSTADVDVQNQAANGSLLAKDGSDKSIVRLRKKEVKGESNKYK
tara:strand:+ start:1189 stop:1635 length:447 start_codon:yes stop_codon:yes gene_type:complete